MATPKQTRRVLRKIYYHMDKLQDALNEAHNMKVIDYPDEDNSYTKYAPCAAASECRDRISKTTLKSRADAFRSEIMSTIK